MSVDEEGVGHVARDNRSVIYVHIVDIIYDIDTLALTRVGWLHNPNILFGVMLLQFLVVGIEITEFVWKDIGIWDEIERGFTEFLLHADHIVAETVFSGDFIGLREVVDFLELVQAFIKIALARRRAP